MDIRFDIEWCMKGIDLNVFFQDQAEQNSWLCQL